MELDSRLLKTFRAVADTRSFTGAAKKLGLTQSSVSQQVITLERGLGVQLFTRSNKFVGLTTAGEIFLQCARQVLDNFERVRAILAERSTTAAGHLAIGAPPLLCHSVLPEVLSIFRVRYPTISLSVIAADPDSMAARLAHRELDLALLPYPVTQHSLGMVQLGRDELLAIVGPQHHLAHCDRLLAKQFQGEKLIVPNPGNRLWAAWDAFLIESGVLPAIIVDTDDLDLAKRLTMAGHGISVAPRWSVQREVDCGELAATTLGPVGVFRQWCLAYHHGSQLGTMRRSFVKLCQDEVPQLLDSRGIKRRSVRNQSAPSDANDASDNPR
jgi:DNA-binding transcriptional LysR family regulator